MTNIFIVLKIVELNQISILYLVCDYATETETKSVSINYNFWSLDANLII